jgi:cytochrome c oxidase subunit 2
MKPDFPIGLQSASTISGKIDLLFYSLLGLSCVVILGVVTFMVVFMVRYRRGSPADRTPTPERTKRIIENTWITVPLLLFMATFVWGAVLYDYERIPPADSREVFVVAKQWMWKMQHIEGQREIDTLHVPRGVPIKLVMISQDVIHSFFVPAFRIKQDVLPGRYLIVWFEATKAGEYRILCAEYCGAHHADMNGRVIVMEPGDYARWLERNAVAAGLAGEGAKLFRKYGCSGCHGDHASAHAPRLEGLYGSAVGLRSGGTALVNDDYLRQSIVRPSAQVVAGYEDVMPAYEGQLKEDQIQRIITYIKSLSATAEAQQ